MQTVQGLTINCPIPLNRAPLPEQAPGAVKLQIFGGKEVAKEIDAVVMVLDGTVGKKIDMDKVVKDSMGWRCKDWPFKGFTVHDGFDCFWPSGKEVVIVRHFGRTALFYGKSFHSDGWEDLHGSNWLHARGSSESRDGECHPLFGKGGMRPS